MFCIKEKAGEWFSCFFRAEFYDFFFREEIHIVAGFRLPGTEHLSDHPAVL